MNGNPFATTEVVQAQTKAKRALTSYAKTLRYTADRLDEMCNSYDDPSEALEWLQAVVGATLRPANNASALNEAARWVEAVGERKGEL